MFGAISGVSSSTTKVEDTVPDAFKGGGSAVLVFSDWVALDSCAWDASGRLTISGPSFDFPADEEISLEDDDAMFCRLAIAALRSEGHIVILAYGGT